MAKKLGYTWYAQNWRSSRRVFRLTLAERGFYRELIDMAYQTDNKIKIELDLWAREFACTEDSLKKFLKKYAELLDEDGVPMIVVNGSMLSIPSCESRLNIIRGGKKGGENSKPIVKPNSKPSTKPSTKPDSNQIEREKEREIETETESENPPPLVVLSPGDLYLTTPIKECVELYFGSKDFELAREQLAISSKIDLTKLKRWAGVFAIEQTEKGILKKTIGDFASHFRNWMKYRNPSETPENYGTSSKSAEQTDEKQLTEWEQTLARNREKYGKPR